MAKSVNELNKRFNEQETQMKAIFEYIDSMLKQHLLQTDAILRWIQAKFGELPPGIKSICDKKEDTQKSLLTQN